MKISETQLKVLKHLQHDGSINVRQYLIYDPLEGRDFYLSFYTLYWEGGKCCILPATFKNLSHKGLIKIGSVGMDGYITVTYHISDKGQELLNALEFTI